jgi:hypothetical protein
MEFLMNEVEWALRTDYFWNFWILPKETVSEVIHDIRNEIEVGNITE